MYSEENGLWIAYGSKGPISITSKMANRHGLIAGATGTGKTVTLQVMAETFCQAGIPCFMADMKGDLSGISQVGKSSSFIEKRKAEFGIENPDFKSCPVRFFDVFGEQGHPMRATISDMGPELLTRLLELNEVQSGVMNIVFRVADEMGLLLLDLKDLRAMLDYVSKHAKEIGSEYGNVSAASVGAIQRALLSLENEGADKFFGEPDFDIMDLLTVRDGRGVMNVLAADRLMMKPKLYSTFLLWLMSELYSRLPEVGDLDKPKLIFFFDEAHMLFEDTSKAMVSKIEQVIRLIRSKGVGIYFISQNPTDIPEVILGQLGNRVQHALRAYTPKDQKAVRAAAETFRANPEFDTQEAITTLETGEALVSVLDSKGAPTVVEKARILFPLSQIGAVTEGQRLDIIKGSDLYGKYDSAVDRESAFEMLIAMKEQEAVEAEQAKQAKEAEAAEKKAAAAGAKAEKAGQKESSGLFGKIVKGLITAIAGTAAAAAGNAVSGAISKSTGSKKSSTGNKVAKNAASTITRSLTRDILGNLLK